MFPKSTTVKDINRMIALWPSDAGLIFFIRMSSNINKPNPGLRFDLSSVLYSLHVIVSAETCVLFSVYIAAAAVPTSNHITDECMIIYGRRNPSSFGWQRFRIPHPVRVDCSPQGQFSQSNEKCYASSSPYQLQAASSASFNVCQSSRIVYL